MRKGIFITSTDTGVGKTIITSIIARGLINKGIDVGVMKPIQTGGRTDSKFLVKMTGIKDSHSLINPFFAKAPLAPIVAFKLEKRNIDIERIKSAFEELSSKHQFMVVEGIGGILVPIKYNYSVLDLIVDLDLPVIIVSRPGLGTINHTLLTIKVARDYGIEVIGVIINNFAKKGVCEKTNPSVISRLGNVPILGEIPHIDSIDLKRLSQISRKIDLDRILDEPTRRDKIYLEKDDKCYVWHPFTQMKDWQKEGQIIIEQAKGNYLKATDGRWYLDAVSSLWVNVHGHRKKEIDNAIRNQLNSVSHSTLLGLGNIPSIKLAKRLVEITPKGLNKVFYSDNGSTACEIGLKIALQYWKHKKTKKEKFISFNNAYHGDTIGAVSLGGIDLFHKIYKPLLFDSYKVDYPYCYRCKLNKKYPSCELACIGKLKKILDKYHNNIGALIIEPLVQAAGGMIVSPFGFLKEVKKLCNRYDVLMIADEVATGFGRTGRMFACEYEGVSPDIMAAAKSITGGYLPLAATLVTDEIYKTFLGDYAEKKTFFHGHTYTGNPLACRAAIANLEIFKKERILEKLRPKIEFLEKELKNFNNLEHVGDIRQKGFMVGIELVKDKATKEEYRWEEKIGIRVIEEVKKHGIIMRPLGNVIVLMPPLSITIAELKFLLDVTYEAIRTVTTSRI
ncbi:MAG: adenosylmethionine--8-amino-7-oxononanoate transaminase [Candidatus Omnitrophica bacterium]|nr:adenosylmethionine--8-amino-7-oxononanoate transaminase [Candidatus Omnitrophota bacterium]